MQSFLIFFVVNFSALICSFKFQIERFDIKPIIYNSDNQRLVNKNLKIALIGLIGGVTTNLISKKVDAVQGVIKISSEEETINAINQVKKCIFFIGEMDVELEKKNYQAIADILTKKEFENFEQAATTLVRSNLLTPDDKVALGTIKRYGLVADALIMLG
jgi:hypothetical protein